MRVSCWGIQELQEQGIKDRENEVTSNVHEAIEERGSGKGL